MHYKRLHSGKISIIASAFLPSILRVPIVRDRISAHSARIFMAGIGVSACVSNCFELAAETTVYACTCVHGIVHIESAPMHLH